MRKRFTFRELQDLVPEVKALLVNADSDVDRIDILGEISSVERGLGQLRRGTQVEYGDGDAGHKWRLEQGRKSVNSYNTPKLITDFAKAFQMPLWDTFVYLWRKDVIRVSWQHTKLEREIAQAGFDKVTAPHEIEEGDPAHIGTYWKDSLPAYKPVVEE